MSILALTAGACFGLLRACFHHPVIAILVTLVLFFVSIVLVAGYEAEAHRQGRRPQG